MYYISTAWLFLMSDNALDLVCPCRTGSRGGEDAKIWQSGHDEGSFR